MENLQSETIKMKHSQKRTDYLSWDEAFMGIANFIGKRSKDPNTQVGACIVDKNNRIVSLGYNGMPNGCDDDDMPWGRDGNMLETKYAFVCHAELNAILNTRGLSLEGTRIYVDLFPCNECAEAIIQSGIKTVIYNSDKYANTDSTIASKMMLRKAGVELIAYTPTNKTVEINL